MKERGREEEGGRGVGTGAALRKARPDHRSSRFAQQLSPVLARNSEPLFHHSAQARVWAACEKCGIPQTHCSWRLSACEAALLVTASFEVVVPLSEGHRNSGLGVPPVPTSLESFPLTLWMDVSTEHPRNVL